jgi:Fic family protein
MSGVRGRGRRGSKSEYRITECPVVDTVTRAIDYGPPEPGDVPVLMGELVDWLSSTHIPHLQLAHRRIEGVKVNHPR